MQNYLGADSKTDKFRQLLATEISQFTNKVQKLLGVYSNQDIPSCDIVSCKKRLLLLTKKSQKEIMHQCKNALEINCSTTSHFSLSMDHHAGNDNMTQPFTIISIIFAVNEQEGKPG
jgi:hypothetical protein